MQLEDYFEFDNPNGIRIRGTRINIEVVIRETLDGLTPEQIVQDYSGLSVEQVHATLAYYHRKRREIDDYIRVQEADYDDAKRQHEQGEQPEVVQRLRKLQSEREGKVAP